MFHLPFLSTKEEKDVYRNKQTNKQIAQNGHHFKCSQSCHIMSTSLIWETPGLAQRPSHNRVGPFYIKTKKLKTHFE